MNTAFHPIDLSGWERRPEFENFTESGCGFTVNAEIHITALRRFAREAQLPLYPLLVAVAARAINSRREFRCAWQGETFGYYEVLHPLFFDRTAEDNIKCMFAEYDPHLRRQAANILSVREQCRDVNTYLPQGDQPPNVVNISCVPWVSFTSISFCLQHCATYCIPILTYGKFREADGRTVLPLSVYCNHAVNDGYHAAMLIQTIQSLADAPEA